jgi:hypothetical protein
MLGGIFVSSKGNEKGNCKGHLVSGPKLLRIWSCNWQLKENAFISRYWPFSGCGLLVVLFIVWIVVEFGGNVHYWWFCQYVDCSQLLCHYREKDFSTKLGNRKIFE